MSGPLLAWVGDDFTGASDTLATLATGGARALLFLDVPTAARLAAVGPLDAVGVATAVRSMDPAAMRDVLEPISEWLARSGVPVVHYKVCSTWDSAPGTGNVGEAVRTLWRPAYAPWVPLVGGQPSLGRWCAHGQLFAQAGAGGPVYRIDRHPTMSRHPVTPMGEARLAVHLAAQGCAPLGRVDVAALAAGDAAIDAAIDAATDAAIAGAARPTTDAAAKTPRTVLFDTLCAAHLAATGAAIERHAHGRTVLAVGASSVAQAMLARWRARGALPAAVEPAVARAAVEPARGPVFVLAGSLSPLSARQVARARAFERVALDAARLAAGDAAYLESTARAIGARLAAGAHVLAGTSIAGPAPRGADPALAPACGALLAAVLGHARCARVGVVGGDTSSRAVQALAPWALGWVGRIGASAPLVRAHADDPAVDGLELMLKGGQMGEDDVLDRLVAGDAH
ncbi:MAG: four-carbon acid sugar kinase family protein [Burkholderiales bacterium]|nr:MAG: four-carbon acid sugar kinase family protein [Burkholderiales bacterium]